MGRRINLLVAAVAIMVVAAVIFVGTALADPATPNSTPPTRDQLTTWMRGMMDGVHGQGSYDAMVQWMDQRFGPGSHDEMLDYMSQGGGCGSYLNGEGQTNGQNNGATPQGNWGGMMGGRGGMMGRPF